MWGRDSVQTVPMVQEDGNFSTETDRSRHQSLEMPQLQSAGEAALLASHSNF
jgi:hypothetical protein